MEYRIERKPFCSYVSLGPLYVEWGDGLLVHVGRVKFACRVRLGIIRRAR